MDVGWS